MKIVFMGTPQFALPALERLIANPHEVILVITQPDRPKGRGRRLEASPIKQVAQGQGLRVIEPRKLRAEHVAETIRESGADLGVVVAYGRVLPREVFEAPRLGCLNIHPSLLPEYRGAAPIQRCLLDGRDRTGVTLMMIEEDLDAGPIVAQQAIDILPDDDARSVGNLCAAVGAEMLLRVIDEAQRGGTIESTPQDKEKVTYAFPIEKGEGLISWGASTEEIMLHLRGMTPWPGAFSFIAGQRRLSIVQAEPLWENEAEELEPANDEPSGRVTSIKKGVGFMVKTGSGHLLVTRVRPEGKREMDAGDFVNGRGIQVGDVLDAEGT